VPCLCYGFLSVIFLNSQANLQISVYDDGVDWTARNQRIHNFCNQTPVLLHKPKQLVQEVSDEFTKHFTKIHQKNLLFNIVRIPSLRLDWCLVPKVASTSLSKMFLKYLPRTRRDTPSPLFLQKELWERAGHLSWDKYTSEKYHRFLIARHPLARLASAYRNKLQDKSTSHDGIYFYNTYSTQIIRMARGKFTEGAAEPSFSEFISYILSTDPQHDDEHWMPVAYRCRVCEVAYTHVLRYEDLSDEWRMFVEDTGLEVNLHLPWHNKGQPGGLKQYYSQIPREKLERLEQRYMADFSMFGYTIDDDF